MTAHRTYWLKSNLDSNLLAKIGRGMIHDRYEKSRTWGFQIEKIRKTEIIGTHIERQEYEDTIEDPLGDVLKFNRVIFRSSQFQFSVGFPQVELTNPPPSFRTLLSQVALYSDFQIFFEPLQVNLMEWYSAIQERVLEVRIVNMDIANIELGESAIAKVLVSGQANVDVSNTVEKIFDHHRGGVIERLGIEWRSGGARVRAEIHRECRAWAKSASAIESIRASLRTLMEPMDSYGATEIDSRG